MHSTCMRRASRFVLSVEGVSPRMEGVEELNFPAGLRARGRQMEHILVVYVYHCDATMSSHHSSHTYILRTSPTRAINIYVELCHDPSIHPSTDLPTYRPTCLTSSPLRGARPTNHSLAF